MAHSITASDNRKEGIYITNNREHSLMERPRLFVVKTNILSCYYKKIVLFALLYDKVFAGYEM